MMMDSLSALIYVSTILEDDGDDDDDGGKKKQFRSNVLLAISSAHVVTVFFLSCGIL